jgi:hypothetical protein
MHNIMDLDAGSVAVVHTRTFVAGSAEGYKKIAKIYRKHRDLPIIPV